MQINGYKIIGINISSYSHNNNTAISLDCIDSGFPSPYAVITVNFEEKLAPDEAYLDTNNSSWVEKFMKDYKLGTPTGIYKQSGWCKYPLYKLDLKSLKELDKEIKK